MHSEPIDDTFLPEGQVTEVRAISRRGHVKRGYFDDLAAMWAAVNVLNGDTEGIYFVPNPINPDLLSRAKNRLVNGGASTTDADILKREWLLIDFSERMSVPSP